MRIGVIASVAHRTPPRGYGPWEQVASTLTEGLVARGHDVTLFATADSVTAGRLSAVVPTGYEEDARVDAKVQEALHLAHAFSAAGRFDVLSNQFDFLPLAFSALVSTPVVTTVHGFSSPAVLDAYAAFDDIAHYVAISDADRSPRLTYAATVHHGLDLAPFTFQPRVPDDAPLLFLGRIHPHKGTHLALEVARRAGRRLLLAGTVQDERYYREQVLPHLGPDAVHVGDVGPAERDALLGGALALLHLIAFAEPFGLAVVEALATGTPVIAFPLGSMPELLDDGRTGFLVPDVEAAVAAVGLVAGLDRAACRAEVERRFTAERMVADYEAVFSAVVAGEVSASSSAGSATRAKPTARSDAP